MFPLILKHVKLASVWWNVKYLPLVKSGKINQYSAMLLVFLRSSPYKINKLNVKEVTIGQSLLATMHTWSASILIST